MKIEDWLLYDAIDRKKRLHEIERPNYDINIHKADLGANLFVLIILIAGIVYLSLS